MVLDNFTQQWKDWPHDKDAIVRNQAHGAPSNILDLYATVDIPEIEGVEPLRIKMASSAGNVTGKKLVSSESATWLNEHFESNLADIKVALDRFMVKGVNQFLYGHPIHHQRTVAGWLCLGWPGSASTKKPYGKILMRSISTLQGVNPSSKLTTDNDVFCTIRSTIVSQPPGKE